MTDVIWTRPSACEANACPQWRPVPGGVALRSTGHPDGIAVLTAAELAALVAAYQAGEVVVNDS